MESFLPRVDITEIESTPSYNVETSYLNKTEGMLDLSNLELDGISDQISHHLTTEFHKKSKSCSKDNQEISSSIVADRIESLKARLQRASDTLLLSEDLFTSKKEVSVFENTGINPFIETPYQPTCCYQCNLL